MNRSLFFLLTSLEITCNTAFAQYQLVEKDGDKSALYFNIKLDNVQGVIYTSIFENFASPQKIKETDTPLKDKGDLYSSKVTTLRLRCKDKMVSLVDGQKFIKQNMQGGMVAYEMPLSEKEVKWITLDKKNIEAEPYRSMLTKCNL
jgi:hypothetical protein